MFIRANAIRTQAGLDVVTDGPTVFTLCSLTQPTVPTNPSVSDTHVVIDLSTDDDWQAVDGALTIYVSDEQNPTINFFKGKYNAAGIISGGTAGHATGTITLSPPAATIGNRYFARAVATAPDGRPSQEMQFQFTVVA